MPRKKQSLIGNGMNANLLKEFIDLSYRGNTSIAPEGYDIDSPLSDSRVKVYAKKGSNDKNIVVTHRGSVGLDDWMDNASYLFRGKVKGTKTYNLHRERHKKAVEKYGAKNIIAIGHSRAGLYIQELNKEFPMKEIISYNKASGFFDIGRKNDENQTDVRVGNDVVSLLAPLQRNPNEIVKIDGTKNPFDFNTAHQTSQIDKLGTTFIGKKEEAEGGAIKRKRGRPKKVKADFIEAQNKKKVGGMYQLGNRLANQLLGIKHPTYYGPHLPSVINVDDVFETDKVSPAYQRETLEYQEAIRAEAEAVKKAQEKMLLALRSRKIGEGIQPRISGANQIRKLLGIELRRLKRIQDGTTKYKSKYMTESKILEKIMRLEERLKSAEANQGHATPDFFVPKTAKWLKINKTDTYLNTPLKADGKHKLMLTEIEKRIAENKAKKEQEDEKKIVIINAMYKEQVKEQEEAKQEAPKKKKFKDLTKEEQIAKKKEYDRLRYLKIKAKAKAKETKELEEDDDEEEVGEGFNKKQLKNIILDKNKVIADLEETAYGGQLHTTNYLDIILDSNSTPQNMIIHKKHFNSVPKYIQPL